jgi:hypothetical protein
VARADAEAGAVPMGLWRASGGTWLALVHSPAGVWLWASGGASPSDRLSRRIPLVGAEGAAPLATPGPVMAAACSLDASDRVHLAWQADETLYYARCALEDLPKGTGWRGPMGEPAPAIVARGVTPRACALAAGARPAIAGERGGGVVVYRFDGEWRETFASNEGRAPVMRRGSRRELHLAFAGPDGIRYHTSPDGERWLPRETPLLGSVAAGPSLALLRGRPVVAGVVNGQAAIAARGEEWSSHSLWEAGEGGSPHLGTDRHGGVWCAWTDGRQIRAARWLGETLSPVLTLGAGTAVLLVEQAPPDVAADLGLLVVGEGAPDLLRLPTPGLALLEDLPTRFFDLLDLVEMRGMVRDVPALASAGVLAAPVSAMLIPGGLVAFGKGDRNLRAWFTLPEEGGRTGYVAEWARGRWGTPLELTLAAPRPWLKPPAGHLSVVRDDEEPNTARRYKMAAESAGSAPALLTSPDGIAWAYYSELPLARPLGLVRDTPARAEERWRLFGLQGEQGSLLHYSSPDREHWYRQPDVGLATADATFWTEEGMLLGLLNGGRLLLAKRRGCPIIQVAELPMLPGAGRVFAPPFYWNGKRSLFLADPDSWRQFLAPEGRWVGLAAAAPDRPGVCVTVPIAHVRRDRHLRVDVKTRDARAGVRIEVLDARGEPVPGYTARIRRADGWRGVSWGRGRALWRLEGPTFRLRFTVEPGACLYGFRFVE